MSTAPRTGPNRPLTPIQKAFADLLLSGEKPARAYRLASKSTMSARCCSVEAQRMKRLPHVAAYLAEKREKQEARAEMSREFLLEQLRSIIEASKPADRIRAIAQASRMLGYDAPQKVEGVAGGQPIVVKWMS